MRMPFVRPAEAPDEPPPGLSSVVPGRAGGVRFSLDALRERIERQFHDETAHRPDILADLDGEDRRRDLLGDAADYVLAVEGVRLAPADRAALLDAAYRNLFTFGPLDDLLADESITEIEVEGPGRIHVRCGGPLAPVAARFESRAHLAAILDRLLAPGGARLDAETPFVEVGATLAGRRARLMLAGPPASPEYTLLIRLHPRAPVTLADLDARAADVLRAIVREHGLLIVGDAGAGKTTLVAALVAALPDGAQIAVVERAAEMRLPPAVTRRTPAPGDPASFGDAIRAALDDAPGWLVIDELRGDESAAVWEALTRDAPPHYVWVFRGDLSPDRLRNALAMLVRRAQPGVEQADIHRALAERLPFVAGLRVIDGVPRLVRIAEWVLDDSGGAPQLALRPLLDWREGALQVVGRPTRPLDLPAEFLD